MNNLSLDDQLKLALACGYEDAVRHNDAEILLYPDNTWEDIFNPRDPDTLMRLCFELRVSVAFDIRTYGWFVDYWYKNRLILIKENMRTQEEIADAIIECSLQVIKERGE